MIQTALIISHGQPNAPAGAEADLAALAAQVAGHLPGWQIGSATLADPAALPRAIAAFGPRGLVYPMFMAGGWFTKVNLPAKLRAAGGLGWQMLDPFGCDPALHDLALQVAQSSGAIRVLVAAHGSSKSTVPSDIAAHVAQRITTETGIPATAAFIDQTPQLAHATGFGTDTMCLPFFAASGDHVTKDLPAALHQSGFQGRILPALGLSPQVPALIARALQSATPACTADCRWRTSA